MTVKRLWTSDASPVVSRTITTIRGGLDGLSDLTQHVNDGNANPLEQKNYVYGPGGLIASENRTLSYQLCIGPRCGGIR